jgi:EmrB/QacA subfamily drug resistance transporter
MSYEPASTLTKQQKVFTMIGSVLGLLLAALDQTIVATAGPAIQRDLHIKPSLYVWITTAYLVASTVLVPVWGKLSDLYGRKRVLIAGMSIFLAGSAACGLSQNTTQLLLFRAVQGLGSAALFTNAFAVVADLFTPIERGKYQGIFGGVFGLSSVIGPLAGGFITDHIGWHWVFYVNLPVGALAFFFVLTRMPALRRPREGKASLDIAGAIALAVFAVPLLLGLSLGHGSHTMPGQSSGWPWFSWQIGALFATAIAGAIAFVVIESRATDPLLDLRLFRIKPFAIGNAAAFVLGLCFLSAIIFLPLFMVIVVGLSATNSGLTTVPLTIGIVIGNITSGQVVSRIGKYKPLMLGTVFALIGAFVLMGFTLEPTSGQVEVSLKMFLVGLFMGPTIPLFVLHIQTSVEPRQIGIATSTVTFSRSMGMTIGAAILGTVFSATLAQGLPNAPQGSGGPEGQPQDQFNLAQVEKDINASFDAKEKGAPPQAVAGMEQGRAAALAQVREVDKKLKTAFTDAISAIYRWCALIAVAGLLVTFLIPALPLRRGPPGGPAPAPAMAME